MSDQQPFPLHLKTTPTYILVNITRNLHSIYIYLRLLLSLPSVPPLNPVHCEPYLAANPQGIDRLLILLYSN